MDPPTSPVALVGLELLSIYHLTQWPAVKDWGSISIPECKDNIVAEVLGADLALLLYEKYVRTCTTQNWSPLPLDRIQGDIKPLLSHLSFQSRFRRCDLVPIIDRFHERRSRIAPNSMTENRPREANFVSDYLSGQGSGYGIFVGTCSSIASDALRDIRWFSAVYIP